MMPAFIFLLLVLLLVTSVLPFAVALLSPLIPSFGWNLLGPLLPYLFRWFSRLGSASMSSGDSSPRLIPYHLTLPMFPLESGTLADDDEFTPLFETAPTVPSSTVDPSDHDDESSSIGTGNSNSWYLTPYFDRFTFQNSTIYCFPYARIMTAFDGLRLVIYDRMVDGTLIPMTMSQFGYLVAQGAAGGPILDVTLWGTLAMPGFSAIITAAENRAIAMGSHMNHIGAVVLIRRMLGPLAVNTLVVEPGLPTSPASEVGSDRLQQVLTRAFARLTSSTGGSSSTSVLE